MQSFTLSRRHQAGLFLVLVATGISLFLEASAKQTAGIALIGLAGTWLVGSLSVRALGILFPLTLFGLGVCLAALPVWADWKAYSESLGQYALAIEDLRLAIAEGAKEDWFAQNAPGQPTDRFDFVAHPTLGKLGFPKNMPYEERNKAIDKLEKSAPKEKIWKAEVTGQTAVGRWIYEPSLKWETVWPPNYFKGTATRVPDGWMDVSTTKTIDIPESTRKWRRPDVSESGAEFPIETPDETILRSIERDFLLPRPTFSMGASLRLHLAHVLAGFILAAAGFTGSGWRIRGALQAKRKESATV